MSRVHDALRKAVHQQTPEAAKLPRGIASAERQARAQALEAETPVSKVLPNEEELSGDVTTQSLLRAHDDGMERFEESILQARRMPFNPPPESLLMDPSRPKEAPSEEFRSLRTRLNHLQTVQPLHTVVVSSASPGEGKSFTACNLAVSQSQLAGKRVLLADFDFRRPTIDKLFGLPSVPGVTDYLLGHTPLSEILNQIGDSSLYVLTAGMLVQNPLELLNLKRCGELIESLRDHFDWVILDSPPLLFAADGNLLATMADATILVVRIGTTTFDSVTRALQSLCENNVVGIVVNGASRGELYSKYSYYHNYYYPPGNKSEDAPEAAAEAEAVTVSSES